MISIYIHLHLGLIHTVYITIYAVAQFEWWSDAIKVVCALGGVTL